MRQMRTERVPGPPGMQLMRERGVSAGVAASTNNDVRSKKLWSKAAYQRWIADGLLLLTALIWGSTFPIVKEIVTRVDPIALTGIRCFVASLTVTLIAGPQIKGVDRKAVKTGVIIGLILFSGYVVQTIGLEYTTASKCGFITGLSVVLVPVFSAFLLGKWPDTPSLIGVGFATFGLALLSLNFAEATLIQLGDFLSLAGAVAFGFHIVAVGKFAPLYDVRILVIMQLWTVAIAAFVMVGFRVFVLGHAILMSPTGMDLIGIGFLGILATALTLFIQNIAQRFTSPTHVAIIFAAEPVFAGVFGWWLLGETFTVVQMIGAALILVGMLVAELIS
jgi:drug/metabolite transporter (DMT)-like permease